MVYEPSRSTARIQKVESQEAGTENHLSHWKINKCSAQVRTDVRDFIHRVLSKITAVATEQSTSSHWPTHP